MRIAESFRLGDPIFSFEFFPPKDPEGWRTLYAAIADLALLRPAFVSVTYGAGGSTRRKTVELVARIKEELGLEAMAHLTCVGHTQDEIFEILQRLWDQNIENILALRGDPPQKQERFQPTPGGFAHASELVRFIRANFPFCVGGAAYPEVHPEAPNAEADLMYLVQKVEAGAEFLITQLFFDAAVYFRFLHRAQKAGIAVPIVPGVMPVTSVSQIERFTRMCGASIPQELHARLDAVRHDPAAVVQVGVDWATQQCRALLEGGAPGIHFYTLNRSHSARRVYENIVG
ncbi:MAG: methylenetetrahydrofolate reductase [NAD(P)H] [Chthonomonadales bacterium]